MIATGWNNGSPNNSTGSGYGIHLSHEDRDKYFRQEWPIAIIEPEGASPVEVNLAPSFWRRCTELHSAAIGKWLLDRGLAPWPRRSPPKMRLEPVGDRRFRLSL
jgi:hypothetical protein